MQAFSQLTMLWTQRQNFVVLVFLEFELFQISWNFELDVDMNLSS